MCLYDTEALKTCTDNNKQDGGTFENERKKIQIRTKNVMNTHDVQISCMLYCYLTSINTNLHSKQGVGQRDI